MEGLHLKSKVSIDDREFLIQTINDMGEHIIMSSLFVDGQILEISKYPHPTSVSDKEIDDLVKTTHDSKKVELEKLLESHKEVLASGDTDLMFSVGTGLFYKHLFTEAQELFASVLASAPDHHQAGNYLGLTHFSLCHFEKAAKILGRVVELRPTFADYHNNYGEALLESGFCRRAVEEFQEALKLNIYYSDAYFNLGIAYMVNAQTREDYKMYSEQSGKAIETLERAILISPEFKTSRYDEAKRLYDAGEIESAISLFKAVRNSKRSRSRQEFSNYHIRYLLFSELISERTVIERIRFLKCEIEKNPNYADLQYELGLCYLQKAQFSWRNGLENFRRAAEINPRLTKAENAMIRTHDFSDTIRETIMKIAMNESE
ncbi:MAG: tetratricopeptide repeat protein [candidate division Zixibacteria bacterium]|nr:tetratricopeptide repeat protein [candidate division Zixibacteria bacterium]